MRFKQASGWSELIGNSTGAKARDDIHIHIVLIPLALILIFVRIYVSIY